MTDASVQTLTLDSEFDLQTEVGQALHRLRQLNPEIRDLSLGRIRRLLHEIGNPQNNLPPVIHIAGTNGKGSSLAFMRAMFESAGYRAHVSTSPHLVRFNERIRLAGKLITDKDLLALIEEVEAKNTGKEITYFEIITVMAFLAFARVPADIVLLETGLGGRLDATNVVDEPAVTAHATISIDHTQFLGNTIAEIAADKAGIMRANVPAVIGRQIHKEVTDVLKTKAQEIGARLFCYGDDWTVAPQDAGFVYESQKQTVVMPAPGLLGAHQIYNAGLAMAALENIQGFALRPTALKSGVANVEWPGRLQLLKSGPLVSLLPPGWEIWLDGAHNDSAAAAAAAQVQLWRQDTPVDLVVGLLSSKNPDDFITPFLGGYDSLQTITIPEEPAALSAEALAESFRNAGADDAIAAESLSSAIKKQVVHARQPRRILISGSLYLVGSVLKDHN